MAVIEKIESREILDSRGDPTLKTTVFLDDGSVGETCVPSGASVGTNEALELRDKDPQRYGGRGVLKAIENVQGPIQKALREVEITDQNKIDEIMRQLDGTENKRKLGANAILSVSLAVAVAAAVSQKTPLFKYLRGLFNLPAKSDFLMPLPMANLIEGGKHAKGGLDFQEFMVVPKDQASFAESFKKIKRVIEALKEVIRERGLEAPFGDEGGLALASSSNEEAIVILKEAVHKAGLEKDLVVGLDLAANTLCDGRVYSFSDIKGTLDSTAFINFLTNLCQKHNLFSLEDPFSEEDWSAWQQLMERLTPATLIIADDLTTTNTRRLCKAINQKVASGVIVKPNQVGTLTETIEFILKAKEAGLKVVVSHRSGETKDTFVSDLAVTAGADFVKIGSPIQEERLEKYKRLLAIEKELTNG
ncbi:MAG: phosphopyruvate hydratase [Candidatus Woykebacteria bacterium GWB1_45_5]|uniref:Enolase n=2 Tax=Candidatus Woykeibacteriota TaxID=1817899 RepID=A0A1G1W1E4_9BACT|nr:MAG: phosphopyruvate hydratase [Candidatus Woykebacteria bacterium GWA1_44_8]OGY24756.1 MAG: phosphopyruvate hydratase [Candidatus Woykebacteria bacterium GWB1_45_5]